MDEILPDLIMNKLCAYFILDLYTKGRQHDVFHALNFPTWNVIYTANHRSNEGTVKEYIESIILPYISKKKEELKLPDEQSALLIFDNFKAQCTSSILTLFDSHNIDVALVPANCTDRLQSLDFSINKAVKDFLRTQFKEWYAQELCLQLNGGRRCQLKLSVVKPLGPKWMVPVHDRVKNNPDLVKKEAGISTLSVVYNKYCIPMHICNL